MSLIKTCLHLVLAPTSKRTTMLNHDVLYYLLFKRNCSVTKLFQTISWKKRVWVPVWNPEPCLWFFPEFFLLFSWKMRDDQHQSKFTKDFIWKSPPIWICNNNQPYITQNVIRYRHNNYCLFTTFIQLHDLHQLTGIISKKCKYQIRNDHSPPTYTTIMLQRIRTFEIFRDFSLLKLLSLCNWSKPFCPSGGKTNSLINYLYYQTFILQFSQLKIFRIISDFYSTPCSGCMFVLMRKGYAGIIFHMQSLWKGLSLNVGAEVVTRTLI